MCDVKGFSGPYYRCSQRKGSLRRERPAESSSPYKLRISIQHAAAILSPSSRQFLEAPKLFEVALVAKNLYASGHIQSASIPLKNIHSVLSQRKDLPNGSKKQGKGLAFLWEGFTRRLLAAAHPSTFYFHHLCYLYVAMRKDILKEPLQTRADNAQVQHRQNYLPLYCAPH